MVYMIGVPVCNRSKAIINVKLEGVGRNMDSCSRQSGKIKVTHGQIWTSMGGEWKNRQTSVISLDMVLGRGRLHGSYRISMLYSLKIRWQNKSNLRKIGNFKKLVLNFLKS